MMKKSLALGLEEGETICGPRVIGYTDHYLDPSPRKPPVVKCVCGNS